ncbi:MAG: hypothetical protein OHK0029_08060 [Armatimonadaceae bacterium]
MSRRKFLSRASLSSLAVAAGAVTGCDRGTGGKTQVRFWNGFTGPDGRTMLRLVKRFNTENPDIQVLMQRMDWNTCYNKLFVAGMGGRAPELFVLHTRNMVRFARAGFLRANDDLISGANGIDTADLDENVWNGVEIGGQHYGLPLDVHALGMYYNRKIFRDSGLTDAQGNLQLPTDRAEFFQALEAMTRPGSGGNPAQWGFVFTNFESNTYTFLRQFGGEFFNEDYSQCLLRNDRNIAALQFCADLIHKRQLAPQP